MDKSAITIIIVFKVNGEHLYDSIKIFKSVEIFI